MIEVLGNFPQIFGFIASILHVSADHDHLSMLASFPLIFGLIASILHVIAGPDHLAAVGPLAVRAKYRPWLIGMSWGVGHVAGMLLIGAIFFFFRELIPIDFISENSERIVGLLLVVIGIWALVKIKSLRTSSHAHDHKHQVNDDSVYVHRHGHEHNHSHEHRHDEVENHAHELKKEKQSYIAAAGIGVLHGFAGVSHIVSMLPTLAFESNYQAIMYLIGFAAGTIVAMIAFSFLLGTMSKWASEKNREKVLIGINIVAGLAAIIVGILWMWSTW